MSILSCMIFPVVYYGLICSLLLSLLMLTVLMINPRLMLDSYPKSIQTTVPSKSNREKKQSLYFMIVFMAVIIFYPLIVGYRYAKDYCFDYTHTSLFVWGILSVFNLFDLFIIDWLVVCFLTPAFLVIPGTKGNHGYKDYKYHFIASVKGIFITLGMALAIAVIIIVLKK